MWTFLPWHLPQCAQHLPTWPPCPSILVSDLIRASSPSWHSQSASFAHTPHPTYPSYCLASLSFDHVVYTVMLRIHMTVLKDKFHFYWGWRYSKPDFMNCRHNQSNLYPGSRGLPTNISSPHIIIKFEQLDKIGKHNIIFWRRSKIVYSQRKVMPTDANTSLSRFSRESVVSQKHYKC